MLPLIFFIIWFVLFFTSLFILFYQLAKKEDYGVAAFCLTIFLMLSGVLIKIYARLGESLDVAKIECVMHVMARHTFYYDNSPCEKSFVISGTDLSNYGSMILWIGVAILALLVLRYILVYILGYIFK